MKRVTLFLIAMLAIAVIARGATGYGIYVEGVEITSDNCSNISCVYGSASFDPTTATLTMDRANFWITASASDIALKITNKVFSRVTLKAYGECVMKGKAYCLYVDKGVDVFIDGPGSVNIFSADNSSIYLGDNSSLFLRGLAGFSFNNMVATSTSSLHVCTPPVLIQTNVSQLGYLSMIGAKFQDSSLKLVDGQIVNSAGWPDSYIRIVSTPDADYNGDGVVDANDVAILTNSKQNRNNFQTFGIFCQNIFKIFLDIFCSDKRVQNIDFNFQTLNI